MVKNKLLYLFSAIFAIIAILFIYLVITLFIFDITRQTLYDRINHSNAVNFKEQRGEILVYVVEAGNGYTAYLFTGSRHTSRFRLYMQLYYHDQSRATVFGSRNLFDVALIGESIQIMETRKRFSTYEIIIHSVVLLSAFIQLTRLIFFITNMIKKRLASKNIWT